MAGEAVFGGMEEMCSSSSSSWWRFFFYVFLMVVLWLLALKVMVVAWWRPRQIEEHFSKQGIKGPPYRFFVGNLKELVRLQSKASSQPMPLAHNILPRVLSFYHHWKKIYGANYLIWFGPTARLTIAEPELIQEIFISRAEFFEKYEAHPLVRQLEGKGLLSLKGEKWAHRRKIINPTFFMENLKMWIPLIGKSVANMIEKLDTKSNNGEVEIDVAEWFQTLTEDVITRTTFGSSYEDGKPVFRLQAQQMVFAAESFGKVLIPGYRHLPSKKNRTSWKLDKEVQSSLLKLIGRRKEDSDDGKPEKEEAKDLLGLMIDASKENVAGKESEFFPNRPTVTVEDIVEECKAFFFAGKHSTSNLLTWTAVLLAMHPEWQELAREEVVQVCGSRDIPGRDDIAKLKKLGMIVNESLRLYPPVVATIRRAKADVELGSYKIPCGTELLIPILAIHHDSGIWGRDAARFNPARFSEGVARAARHPMAFLPFGLGCRTCIGQNLALMHAKLTLAILLQRFSFHLSPSYRHAPTVLMLLYPQYGAPIVFRRLCGPLTPS